MVSDELPSRGEDKLRVTEREPLTPVPLGEFAGGVITFLLPPLVRPLLLLMFPLLTGKGEDSPVNCRGVANDSLLDLTNANSRSVSCSQVLVLSVWLVL